MLERFAGTTSAMPAWPSPKMRRGQPFRSVLTGFGRVKGSLRRTSCALDPSKAEMHELMFVSTLPRQISALFGRHQHLADALGVKTVARGRLPLRSSPVT